MAEELPASKEKNKNLPKPGAFLKKNHLHLSVMSKSMGLKSQTAVYIFFKPFKRLVTIVSKKKLHTVWFRIVKKH